jgi:hypothetical protein
MICHDRAISVMTDTGICRYFFVCTNRHVFATHGLNKPVQLADSTTGLWQNPSL